MNNDAINLLHRCVSILRKNDLDVNAEMLKQKDRWVTCSTIGDPGDKKGSFLFVPKLGLLKCINYKRVDGYQTVSLKDEAELSASDRKQLRKLEKIWDEELQGQTKKMHDFTAVHAYSQYREFDVPTASNAYLTKKAMPVLSRMRCEGENLILPILNSVGEIVNYESISPDGEKRTLPGGKTSGCIYPIFTGIAPVSVDDSNPDSIPIDIGYELEKIQHLDSEFCALHAPDGSPVLCITEGYATGYAVHMATGCDTIAVRSANNIDPALQAILKNKKYEQYSIIICADNDIRSPSDKNQENTGVVKAKKASEVYGTYLAISPAIQNKKSDFDDVFRNPSLGPACVRETIKKAIAKGASPKIPACFEYDRATGVLEKIYTRGEQVRKEVICKGLFIRGLARDKASMGWGKVVELLDPCGMKHSLFISHGDLAAGQSALFDKLCHNGLQLATTSSATKQAFCDFVTAYETKCFLRLATRPGWMDNMYVARDKVIGYDGTGEEPYLLSASPMLSQKAGDWEACKRMLHLRACLEIALWYKNPS